MSIWKNVLDTMDNPLYEVRIGIIGKYVDLKESYKSLNEALIHAGIENNSRVNIVYIDSEKLEGKLIEI